MKEKMKSYWTKNGFYLVLTAALVIVLSISGVAGYRSGMKDKKAAENAAEFSEAQNTPAALEGSADIENAVAESISEAQAANAAVAETFGDEAEMVWPVQGGILKDFSMDTTIYFETLDQYKCNPGLLIQADVNQEVVAAFGGTVETVEEDSVNGMTVSVDMGNGYRVLYGQMKDIKVKAGDAVVKGQALGNVAQPTKYYTEEGSHLCFALTKDGSPVNPQDYLS